MSKSKMSCTLFVSLVSDLPGVGIELSQTLVWTAKNRTPFLESLKNKQSGLKLLKNDTQKIMVLWRGVPKGFGKRYFFVHPPLR